MPSYLGIDASLEGTGLCLVSAEGLFLRAETVSTGLRGMERLVAIRRRVEAFLDPEKLVGLAAVEGYAYAANGKTLDLAEGCTAIKLVVFERGVRIEVMPPTSLKKFATCSSHAKKAEMIEAARAGGAVVNDDNQADAFHLARVAWALDTSPMLPRFQRDALAFLTSPRPSARPRRPRRLVKNVI